MPSPERLSPQPPALLPGASAESVAPVRSVSAQPLGSHKRSQSTWSRYSSYSKVALDYNTEAETDENVPIPLLQSLYLNRSHLRSSSSPQGAPVPGTPEEEGEGGPGPAAGGAESPGAGLAAAAALVGAGPATPSLRSVSLQGAVLPLPPAEAHLPLPHSDSQFELSLAGLKGPFSPGAPGAPFLAGTESPHFAPAISFLSHTAFPPVRKLHACQKRRILVTGGAGFVGSHLVDRLMCLGHDVVVLDNFFSGTKTTLAHWVGHPNFEMVRADVVEPFLVEVDEIFHLACPASPKAYQLNAVKTLKTNFVGTMNMLGLAKRVKARFLLASTSEVYGSPEEHPQAETYWGHVNCTGPRACYDEGKRVAEALTYGYHRQDGVDVRVARIFNCYGPRMRADDGRLVSNFVVAALRGVDLAIYGDGTQTRSLTYVHDLVSGLVALMDSDYTEPVNLGSTDEASVLEWATRIRDTVLDMRARGEIPADRADETTGERVPIRRSEIVFEEAVVDDPPRRKPDTTRANDILGWRAKWSIDRGIRETIRYFSAKQEEEEM